MINYCLEAGIPAPNYLFEGSDFLVEFRKDIYHEEYLIDLGLNERQIKAVLFVKENRKITNSDYQKLNEISKRTATNELTELVEKYELFDRKGTSGSNIFYIIVGQ